MKRILLTGMSGAGKSAVIRELAGRGHDACDLDDPAWSEWVAAEPEDGLTPAAGRDWAWREDRVRLLLSEPRAAPLFAGGCASNMRRLFPLFDTIVLLSALVAAAADTILRTVRRTRTDGRMGRRHLSAGHPDIAALRPGHAAEQVSDQTACNPWRHAVTLPGRGEACR